MSRATDATEARAEALFDRGDRWEAHELWEELWHAATDASDRHFYQGLIQCAAALLHASRGKVDGPRRLLARARGHFRAIGAPLHRGVALLPLIDRVDGYIGGRRDRPVRVRELLRP